MLGSLHASWNAFSPHPCPTDVPDALVHAVIPGEFNLRSVGVSVAVGSSSWVARWVPASGQLGSPLAVSGAPHVVSFLGLCLA